MSSIFSSVQLNNLEDLFLFELRDAYDGEQRLIEALPRLADAATNQQLKAAFLEHLDQTRQHLSQLERIFGRLGKEVDGTTCAGMKGIISEGEDIIDASADPDVKDAALIGAAQRAEHYEIAAYGTLRAFAHRLGLHDVADMLQATLDQEGQADKKLTQIAESMVNVRAEQS